MNKLLSCVVLMIAAIIPPLFAESAPVTIGMPVTDLVAAKGTPQSKAGLGKKFIYRWPDMQVTVVDGKVESFKLRNIEAEKVEARENAQAEANRKANAEAKAREKVLDSREATTYSRIEANAANRETEERMRRAASIQQQIRSIEKQLDDDSKRSAFSTTTPPMSAEGRAYLNLRLDNLRAELANLR